MHITEMMKNSDEFNQIHSCEQLDVHFQLAVTLYRLGSSEKEKLPPGVTGALYKKLHAVFLLAFLETKGNVST